MSVYGPSRRTVLRAAGALPLFGALPRRVRAAATKLGAGPRLIVYFTPNGLPEPSWRPSSQPDKTDFTLSAALAPLERHKKELLVLQGLSLLSSRTSGHEGAGSLLTGTAPGLGASIDHVVAQAGGRRSPSLSLAVLPSSDASPSTRISFAGAGAPNTPVGDPLAVYARLFQTDRGALTFARRRGAIDAAKANVQRMAERLSGPDRTLIERHAEALREVELSLSSRASATGCAPASPPKVEAKGSEDQAAAVQRVHLDVLALAFACDLARSATFMAGTADLPRPYPQLGITQSWSDVAHSSGKDESARAAFTKIASFHATEVAGLVDRLKAVPVGAGTLFDETVILWGTDCRPDHSHVDVPFIVVAGSKTGLATGRSLTFPEGTPHNRLLVSLLQSLGFPETKTFGDAELSRAGPLPGLR